MGGNNVKCDICKVNTATKDAKLKMGPWAYVCESCFRSYAIGNKGLYSEINKMSEVSNKRRK